MKIDSKPEPTGFIFLCAAHTIRIKIRRYAQLEPIYVSYTDYSIIEHVVSSKNNQEIADAMGLDEKTIRNHLTEIYRQLGIRSRYDLKTQVNKKIFLVAKSDTNL